MNNCDNDEYRWVLPVICIILFVSLFIWFFRKDNNSNNISEKTYIVDKINEPVDKPKFIKSNSFTGSIPGYVFYRSDEYGIGYHLDRPVL